MIRRHIEARIVESLADTPAVFLQGARQCGKSTLARIIAEAPHPARYVSLDDATAFAAAQADPEQFIANQPYPLVIDEVQRVPQLFRAIKASVDRDRRAGRFLLTGSADVAVVPELSHSLAGRVEVHTLWPFSQGELEGRRETFIEALFSPHLPTADLRGESRVDLLARASTGGYPEPIQRSAERRHAWFESYVTTILQREVRDLTNLGALGELPRLLTGAASRTAQLLNYAELARTLSLPQTTLKRYLALLLGTFLVRTLPAWFRNVGKRLAKAPKLVVADTGLASHLLGIDAGQPRGNDTASGRLLESFAIMELEKQSGWSVRRPRLFHYRTHAQREVDIVLEDRAGEVVGIEVKASASVRDRSFAGLRDLEDAAGGQFVRGIVLYAGDTVVPFSDRLHAVPFNALWRW